MKKLLIILLLMLFITGCNNKNIETNNNETIGKDEEVLDVAFFGNNSYSYDKKTNDLLYNTHILINDDVPYNIIEFDYELIGKYKEAKFYNSNNKGSEFIQEGNHIRYIFPDSFLDEYKKQGNSYIVAYIDLSFKKAKDCGEFVIKIKNITLRNTKTGKLYKVKDTNKVIYCNQNLKY